MGHLKKHNLERLFSDTVVETYIRAPEDRYLNFDSLGDCLFDFSLSETVIGEHVRSVVCKTGVPFVFNNHTYVKTMHKTPTHCIEKTGVLYIGVVYLFKLKYISIENPTECETYIYPENISHIRNLYSTAPRGSVMADDNSLLVPSILATMRDVLFKLNMRTSSGFIERFIYRIMSNAACLERTYSNILVTPNIYDMSNLKETVINTLDVLFSEHQKESEHGEYHEDVGLYKVPEPCMRDIGFMSGTSTYKFDTVKKKKNVHIDTHDISIGTSDQTLQLEISDNNREHLYTTIDHIQRIPHAVFIITYEEQIEITTSPSQYFELSREHSSAIEDTLLTIKKHIMCLDTSRILCMYKIIISKSVTDILSIRIYSNDDVYGLCIDLNSMALNSRSLTYI